MNIVVADQPSAGNGTSDETGKSNSSAGSDAYYHDSFVDQIDSMLQLQKQRAEQLRKDYIKESTYQRLSTPSKSSPFHNGGRIYKPEINIDQLLQPLEHKWKSELTKRTPTDGSTTNNQQNSSKAVNQQQPQQAAVIPSPLDQKIKQLKEQIRSSLSSLNQLADDMPKKQQQRRNQSSTGTSKQRSKLREQTHGSQQLQLPSEKQITEAAAKPLSGSHPLLDAVYGNVAAVTTKNDNSSSSRPQTAQLTAADENGKSIAQRRLEQYLAEKEAEVKRELSFRFKAKPIPKSSLVPLLDQIKQRQADRRKQTVTRRLVELRETVKPFSLTATKSVLSVKRATTVEAVPVAKKQPAKVTMFLSQTDPEAFKHIRFRAAEIPMEIKRMRSVKDLRKQEEQRKQEREQRVKRRATALLANASLPPRMAKPQKKSVVKLPHFTFKPRVNHKIPNFKRLQRVFAEQLRANKERLREHMRNKQKSLARGRVFNVAVSGVKHHSLKHPNRRQQIQEAQAAAQKALMSQRPTQAAASAKHKIGKKNWSEPAKETRSFQLKRQYAKRLLEEMQHIQREQEQKLQLEADRKRVLAAKIRNALHVEEAEYQRRKAEIELKWSQMTDNNSHEYRSLLSQMNQKLDARPCMFERVTAEEARKHVQQLVSSTLKSKGVK